MKPRINLNVFLVIVVIAMQILLAALFFWGTPYLEGNKETKETETQKNVSKWLSGQQQSVHAIMQMEPPKEPSTIWPLLNCLSGKGSCQVTLNKIAALRGAGRKVQLCYMVDTKAECMELPAKWKE